MSDEGLTARIGGIVFTCEPRGTHYHVTVRGHGSEGHRPLLGKLTLLSEEWHDLVDQTTPDWAPSREQRFAIRSALVQAIAFAKAASTDQTMVPLIRQSYQRDLREYQALYDTMPEDTE